MEPGQLLLFVQSFGIPVQSMSRLLQCLDTAVEDDPEGMENSVVDKVRVHSCLSDGDIDSRWVQREFNLKFTLRSSKKCQEKNSLLRSLNENGVKYRS